ncbi:hypothetical protein SGPA1_41238 [Streptomyces misionensis JCM 4497]
MAADGHPDLRRLGRAGVLHAQGRGGRGQRRDDLRLDDHQRTAAGAGGVRHDGRFPVRRPVAGARAHRGDAGPQRGRRAVPGHGVQPGQGHGGRPRHQRTGTGADHRAVPGGLSNPPQRMGHPRHRAGPRRLDPDGLQRREERREFRGPGGGGGRRGHESGRAEVLIARISVPAESRSGTGRHRPVLTEPT